MSIPADLDLEALVAEFQRSGLRELHVRREGVEIYLSNDPDAAGLDGGGVQATRREPLRGDDPAPAASPVKAPSRAAIDLPPGAVIVPAPYLGTFYRSPKPGAEPYVEIGQRVVAETELCLVEVMKLFTAVSAGTAGTIHAVLAGDGEVVAADQPLFAILPD